MVDEELGLDLGILCRCCDCSSYRMPDTTGLTDSQIGCIERLCKLCIEINSRNVVNS